MSFLDTIDWTGVGVALLVAAGVAWIAEMLLND
jgi:hypothetical protein